jgi:hypothetical protein
MRYYVDNSSYFDSHPYNKPRIAKIAKAGGGKNVRAANKFGWSNQPQVVTFDAGEVTAKKVGSAVEKALGTSHIIIRKKDW